LRLRESSGATNQDRDHNDRFAEQTPWLPCAGFKSISQRTPHPENALVVMRAH
jgi:hypothetical protein